MAEETSLFRLHLLRLVFFLNFAFLGLDVWPQLINHPAPWDPVRGVAVSFWATLSTLSLLGLRYPLKMVPLLFVQFLYKSIWLIAVLPRGFDRPTTLIPVMAVGIVADLLVMPWSHVVSAYVKSAGDRWK